MSKAMEKFINELTTLPLPGLSDRIAKMMVEGRTMDDAKRLMTALELFIEQKAIQIFNEITLEHSPPFAVPSAEKEELSLRDKLALEAHGVSFAEDEIGMSGYLNKEHMEADRAAKKKERESDASTA